MKIHFETLVVVALFYCGSLAATPMPEHQLNNTTADQKAITQTVLDYVEGWYSADAKRMDNALSEHLAKRRITPEGQLMAVSKAWMVQETGNGRGRIPAPEQGRKEVTILVQTSTIASVMLISNDFVDYLHLVKIGDTWKIANALWDYRKK
ncbi:putative lumazine-binding protein [Alteromonadaceae bacterium 2753L.S.0a.02]|nr:putative lumazine-binding protein [Alteromonadaceae bacterium 2753L.S.0a.02]